MPRILSTSTRGVFQQNQFGGTVGGPIKKDKVFFFLDYQGTRTTQGITSPETTVLSLPERNGNFSDAASSLTGNCQRILISPACLRKSPGLHGYPRAKLITRPDVPARRILCVSRRDDSPERVVGSRSRICCRTSRSRTWARIISPPRRLLETVRDDKAGSRSRREHSMGLHFGLLFHRRLPSG